ncbi:sensor domain-containing diguanylate cyclase [Chitinivorax sp. PXF-14]|uniref:diguanylate cyclase n=1 Tax=Chitinivorax sp. PXF-14 TaxID=3230488 RepID=UPI003466A98A
MLLLVGGGFVYLTCQHRRQVAASALATRIAKEQALVLNNERVGMVRVEGRHILWANRAIHRILGYDDGAVAGASMRLLYPDDTTFDHIGALGYEALRRDGRFHTQVKMRTRTGNELWVDLSATALTNTEFLWMVVDLHQLKHSGERAQHQALHDGLTGLPNRHLFEELLRQAVAQAKRDGQGLTVCYLDLDGFKPVNDTLGHHAGDEVLRAVGDRLRSKLRSNDSAARLGGDEFAWFLSGVANESEARAVVERCIEIASRPIELTCGATVRVGGSIGLASSDDHGYSADRLLQAADEAMYQHKHAGRTRDTSVETDRLGVSAHATLRNGADRGDSLLDLTGPGAAVVEPDVVRVAI